MQKLIRITTVPSSLRTLLKGQLNFMRSHFNILGVSSSGDALLEVEQNEQIATQAIEMTRTITPIKDSIALIRLFFLFRSVKPHIVHSHTPKAGLLSMIAAKLAGVKHRVHTVAGMPLLVETGTKRKLLNFVEKLTYTCATHVLPNSNGLKSIILEYKFCDDKKLKVIGNGSSNGIDTSHYNPDLVSEKTKNQLREELNITKDDFVFIFIGRVVSDKGINELVEAFNELSKVKKKTKLLLVGPSENHLDPLKEQTEKIIKTNPHILAVGNQKDIRPFVCVSDVLTFPSYREGFPNVVLQCSAMNLPCVVSDINGCNEIISHHQNGIIVPTKSSEKLKNAMLHLIDNPSEKDKMALNARSNIQNKYEQQYVWEEILKFYKSL
ncbi:MAG: glycosyltransferase family 1 protein [Bacteroidetes bacterium MedPE-SWsnd-G2]|nr:MAG: glycosyltransferase family 1 protein [Bacteroidetes bacterium MedPE-SWsnd-G2]